MTAPEKIESNNRLYLTERRDRLIDWVVARPRSILIFFTLTILLLSSGILNLTISNDFRVYLSKDNPQLIAFEQFEDNYVKSDSATIVITAKQGDIFTDDGLRLLSEITERLWLVEHVYRVNSLANYQHLSSVDDEIVSNPLVPSQTAYSASEINQIREIALQEKRLVKSMVSADGTITVVVANMQLPKEQANISIDITKKLIRIRDDLREKYPDFSIDNGGSTAFNSTLANAVKADLTTLIPLSYSLIFIGLLIFLRSFMASMAIFVLISTCLISTFGVVGWTDPVLTPIAGFAPSILLSIMVADSVHVLVTFFQLSNTGQCKTTAISNSLKINFMPILLTSVTTIIGFLGLNFSSSPPYQDLGNMVAIGVFFALIFSLFLLPCLMLVLPITAPRTHQSRKTLFVNFAHFVIHHKKSLLLAVSIIVVALSSAISNIKLTDNWAKYFDDSFPIVQLVNRIDGRLTGINSLEYSLRPSQGLSIFDPSYLTQMDQFESWFLSQEKVVNTNSLSGLMKSLNKVMHNDSEGSYTIPETRQQAAQYLLFYEIGLPQGVGLNNLVTIHQTASRFSVSVKDSGSDELLALDQAAQNWLKANAPSIRTSEATGLGMVFAHIAQRNIVSLLSGTLLILISISALLMFVMNSVKLGLISLVPNIIPAAMAYGFWGLNFGYVDISLSIVACSTLGIVVDDTVHFLHKYQLAKQAGKSAAEAVVSTFSRVGLALLTTTIVLSSGFIVLAVSHMNTSAAIGMLMAITLVFALIVDFLLLPPLLLYLDKSSKKPDRKNQMENSDRKAQIEKS
jgi:predicted RND superfamily exporter protein